MSEVVIRAQDVGKAYMIGHESADRPNTLRDAVTRGALRFGRSLKDVAKGQPIYAGDELEQFWALKSINFEVNKGDVLGIIGKNGAGKSTLLKVLSRITDPTEGRLTLTGRVASLLEVGTGFHPELSGRENIFLNGAILGMSRAEIKSRFDEIVEFSGVERFLDTPVKRYSSGMYVRLAFSVAAHLEPEILIIDEVLAVGDTAFQEKCLGKMQSLAGGGRTVIFVSHQLPSVARLCSRVMLIEEGRVKAEGSPDEMISLYRGEGTSNSIDIDFPADGEKHAQLINIKIENDGSKDASLPLTLDCPLKVSVELLAKKPVGEIALSFALLAPDGTIVLASNSANAGIDVSFSQARKCNIELTLEGGQLLNCELICRVALWSKLDGILDEFETRPFQFAPRVVSALPVKLNGFVNARVKWNSIAKTSNAIQ